MRAHGAASTRPPAERTWRVRLRTMDIGMPLCWYILREVCVCAYMCVEGGSAYLPHATPARLPAAHACMHAWGSPDQR